MTNYDTPKEKAMNSDHETVSGKTTIAPGVLHTIARLTALNVGGVSRLASSLSTSVNRLFKGRYSEGIIIDIQDDVVYLDLFIILKSNVNIRDVSRNIQRNVARAISEMVGMQVGRVNIHVEDIDYPEEIEAYLV
jgi:uncharacterized alkaline shock family protein YloU